MQPASSAAPRELEVDVLPMPVAVELDRDPALRGLREHAVPVAPRLPARLLNIAARGMAEDRHAGAAHRAEHPRRSDRPVRRSSECGEATTNSNTLAFVGLQVEAAVGEDVRLDPLEDAEPSAPARC